MLLTNQPVVQVSVPLSLLSSPERDEPARSARRRNRDLVHRMSAIAALRHSGCAVEPIFTDDHGVPVPEERMEAPRNAVEPGIRELSQGRIAHARRTIAELTVSQKSDAEQVDALLDAVYQAHARGERSTDVLEPFLDSIEPWLTREGVARVDLLLDRLDLDRAPESLGILLLATTRLTRAHFVRRDAFVERLRRWLVGRAGRTEQDVDRMLRGLRE